MYQTLFELKRGNNNSVPLPYPWRYNKALPKHQSTSDSRQTGAGRGWINDAQEVGNQPVKIINVNSIQGESNVWIHPVKMWKMKK